MKTVKHILAFVLALALLTSCGLLGGMSSNTGTTQTTNTSSTGINTGSALATIFNVLKNTGMLDLGNLTNLINLGQILMGANSLTNASQAYTDQFAQDLIAGSNKMINKSNVNDVIAGLKKLAASDTSVLSKATQSAYTGSLVPVSTANKDVKANITTIEGILNAMK